MQSTSKKEKTTLGSNRDTSPTKPQDRSCNIKVFIRVRPTLPSEFQKEVAVSANKEVTSLQLTASVNLFSLLSRVTRSL